MELSKNTYSKSILIPEVSEDILEKYKRTLVDILLDFSKVCEKYKLRYSLGYGTLLGAIRHKGFIPWDDDIDIVMERKFYDLLPVKMKEEYGDKYFFAGPKFSSADSIKFLKIMKAGTKIQEFETVGVPEQRGIGIDVFPIENMPSKRFLRRIKGLKYNFFAKIPSLCMDFHFPSSIILEASKTDKKLRRYYSLRRFLGFLASFRSIKKWTKTCEKNGFYPNTLSDFECIPTGRKGYFGEIFKRTFIENVSLYEFEGHLFYGFSDYDSYLKNLYGNYMEIPPVEKREKHNIISINFGEK